MVQTNFRAGDFGKQTKKPAAKKAAAPKAEPKSSTPPDGTSQEILDWVDGDADRAALALEKEQSHKSPRASLVKSLEKITK